MLRHLPPTATPLSFAEWRRSLRPNPHALSHFEQALSDYLSGAPCLTAASGRAALFLALRAMQKVASQRTDVVLPAYTCPSVAKVVFDLDLTPVLVDLDPRTLHYEPDALAAVIGASTLAVLVVHPFGVPQPVTPVAALAHAAGAFVVEDAAQSLGARWAGAPVGVHGDVGLFSLGPGKPLSTGGGGVLCVNAPDLLDPMRWAWADAAENRANLTAALRLGVLSTAFRPLPWWLATRLGAQKAGNSEAGMRYAVRGLSPAQAAVGSALLPRLDAINARRRQRAEQIRSLLANVAGIGLPEVPDSAEAIYLRLPIVVYDGDRRERIYSALNRAGIGVGKMYRQTLAAIFPQLAVQAFPGAAFVADHLLTLPTHHFVTDEDVARVAALVRTV